LGVATYFHEPWRDEADSWLAARDLSVAEVFHFSGYVGVPALWHLVLMPFAKLGAPYATLQCVHYVIAVASAWVVLRHAPFPMWTRIAAVFSYYLAYEYAVIARNYGLLVLLLFVCAALYHRRSRSPFLLAVVVALLFNTSAHGWFFAAFIATLIAWDWLRRRTWRPKHLAAVAIMLAGGIVAALQLWPPADSQRPEFFELRYPGAILDVLTRAIVIPIGPAQFEPLWLVLNLIILLAAAVHLARRPPLLALFAAGIAALLYIFVFKWSVPERHAGLILLWLIFILWIARIRGGHVIVLLTIGLLQSCVVTAVAFVNEVRIEYSHAAQVAQVIRARDLDRRPVASSTVAESVLPYLRCRQFWNVDTQRWLSHNRWDRLFHENWDIKGGTIWQRIEEEFPPDQRPVILWHWSLPYHREHGYELVYKTQGPVGPSKEVYFLYVPLQHNR
jgi:hypothetical protein